MRAEIRGEIDILRLVEVSDEVARFEHRAQHRCGIPRIGPQIAVAQVMRGKQGRTARKVKHEIAVRSRAVARRFEDEDVPRGDQP